MKKILKLMISLTLVMAIGLSPTVSHLPNTVKNKVSIFADELPDATPGPDENTEDIEYTKACEEEAYIVEEAEDLREANKKYFNMSDGSIKACIYPQAVHYESNGEYLEIDNSLELIEVESEEFIQLEEDTAVLENEAIDNETVIDEETDNEIIVDDITDVDIENSVDTDNEAMAFDITDIVIEDSVDTDNEEAIAADIESTTDIESIIDIENEAISADKYINRTKPSRKGAYYKNKENSFIVKLPEVYGEDYTEFTDENGFVSFKLLDAKKINLKKEDIKTINENDEKIARNVTDKGSYKSIKKNIDLEYDVSGNMLKETIVLNAKTKEDFKFEIKTSAKEVKLNEDKSVSFYDENANELYRISAPYMTDAIGEYSTAIDVDLEESPNGYLLKLKPDEEWLNDEKREYPIKIDPTMFKALDVENITDTYVSTYQNDTYPDIWGEVDVLTVGARADGNVMRAMMHFSLPSSIGANDSIVDAKLYLVHYFGVYDSEITDKIRIDVHELTGDFSEKSTYWNNKPGFDETVIDYGIVDKSRYFPNTEISYDVYNITELVSKWHNGETNHGLLLKYHDEEYSPNDSDDDREVYYFAKQSKYYKDVTRYVEITYRNTLGIEDYWTYDVQDASSAGVGYINLFNGNNVFVHEDVGNNTLINSFNLSHVYNSGLSDTTYTTTEKNYYGNGWSLNLTQTLRAVNISGNSKVKYVYEDADKTKHYLVENNGKIVDEDGLGLTFSSLTNETYKYQLSTKENLKMQFDQWGDLRKLIDTNGNYINLNYSPIEGEDNYLTSITTSNGDGIKLHYNDSHKLDYMMLGSKASTMMPTDCSVLCTPTILPNIRISWD